MGCSINYLIMACKVRLERLLKYMFLDFRCMVRVGNDLSRDFIGEQGIHQLSPCSMFLYQVYINELLNEINSNVVSAKCVGICAGAITYADDITLLANSQQGLQARVSIASKYSKKWRFTFNASKCSVLLFDCGESV